MVHAVVLFGLLLQVGEVLACLVEEDPADIGCEVLLMVWKQTLINLHDLGVKTVEPARNQAQNVSVG